MLKQDGLGFYMLIVYNEKEMSNDDDNDFSFIAHNDIHKALGGIVCDSAV